MQTQFGKYTLLQKLGDGGMSEVFLAQMQGPGGFTKVVALKRMLPHLNSDRLFTQSFINEARLGGHLNHHNIVQTLEFGDLHGHYYLAMEYVRGVTLAEVLRAQREKGKPLPQSLALEIAIQMAEGLEYAHNAEDAEGKPLHMIHRDLKPSNILINNHGVCKIADFGVARAESNVTQTVMAGDVKGTVSYMSPEQAMGRRDIDYRSDLYSIGSIMFELFTNDRLYPQESYLAVLRKVQDGDTSAKLPKLLAVERGERVHAIVGRALANDPNNRYQNASELVHALRELQLDCEYEFELEDYLKALLPNSALTMRGTMLNIPVGPQALGLAPPPSSPGSQPGMASSPGAYATGGSRPGGRAPNGSSPGAYTTGGSRPGGRAPNGSSPGAYTTGGSSPGAYTTGGSSPGAYTTGGSSPGRPSPTSSSPGSGGMGHRNPPTYSVGSQGGQVGEIVPPPPRRPPFQSSPSQKARPDWPAGGRTERGPKDGGPSMNGASEAGVSLSQAGETVAPSQDISQTLPPRSPKKANWKVPVFAAVGVLLIAAAGLGYRFSSQGPKLVPVTSVPLGVHLKTAAGKDLGQTPTKIAVPEGGLTVEATLDKYLPSKIQLTRELEGREILIRMERKLAAVTLKVTPTDARVELDDQPLPGPGPFHKEELQQGKHNLRISKAGFETLEQVIFLEKGEDASLDFKLDKSKVSSRGQQANTRPNDTQVTKRDSSRNRSGDRANREGNSPPKTKKTSENPTTQTAAPATPPGYLTINAFPYAHVEVDGVPIKTTPLLRHSLRVGPHVVKLRTSDGREKTLNVSIKSGETAKHIVRFDASP